MKTKIATTLIYLCAAVTTIGVALTRGFYPNSVLPRFALLLAAMLLVVAALALRYRPSAGHLIALTTETLTLAWLCRQPEFGSPIENAWIALNIPDNLHEGYYISDAKLTILAVWFIVAVIGIATLRLLPVNWTIRGLPVRNRTWPAVVASFIVLGVWFSKSASPYRIAGVVDANYSTVQVLHIEKRGLQFHEVLVEVSRDASFRISRDDRRLFEYRFQQIETTGAVPLPLMERALALVASTQLRNMHTVWPKPMRAWNADGWYFHAEGSPLLSFSTETDTRPPPEIVEFFQQVEALAPKGSMLLTPRKDVCLGFCYDPAAALGVLYTNQRCRRNGNGYRCF